MATFNNLMIDAIADNENDIDQYMKQYGLEWTLYSMADQAIETDHVAFVMIAKAMQKFCNSTRWVNSPDYLAYLDEFEKAKDEKFLNGSLLNCLTAISRQSRDTDSYVYVWAVRAMFNFCNFYFFTSAYQDAIYELTENQLN